MKKCIHLTRKRGERLEAEVCVGGTGIWSDLRIPRQVCAPKSAVSALFCCARFLGKGSFFALGRGFDTVSEKETPGVLLPEGKRPEW